MQLKVLSDERFSCHSCGECCRGIHVELINDEADRIALLKWGEGDELSGRSPIKQMAGKKYVAHKADGGCLFLNEANGLCRIHERFGEQAKPFGCRVFPFRFTRTFGEQVTVAGRFECPSVGRNEGAPHSERRGEITQYAKGVSLGKAFDEKQLAGLSPSRAETIVDWLIEQLMTFRFSEQRAVFLYLMAEELEQARGQPLDRKLLDMALGPLLQQVNAILEAADEMEKPESIGAMGRLALRSLLATYLRRDEDVIDGQVSRLRRAMAVWRTTMGGGNLRGLAVRHDDVSISNETLLERPFDLASDGEPEDEDAEESQTVRPALPTDVIWRAVAAKLGAFQFMGGANFGLDFYAGIRSLALIYPLTIATAKLFATADESSKDQNSDNRDGGPIALNDEDVRQAIAAIDHSFGRLPLLDSPMSRTFERFLMQRENYLRLVFAL